MKTLILACLLASTAWADEVPPTENQVVVAGHPLTSVVVTQCNQIVVIYMTMPDGKLLRFDKSSTMSADQLLTMAYTADRSERVELSCKEIGVQGYERHDPV